MSVNAVTGPRLQLVEKAVHNGPGASPRDSPFGYRWRIRHALRPRPPGAIRAMAASRNASRKVQHMMFDLALLFVMLGLVFFLLAYD